MATPILKIITEYCAQYVNDERMQHLAADNMPLYARRMWGTFRAGIPFFNNPPTIQEYLLGSTEKPMMTAPRYASYQYQTETDLTADTTITLDGDFAAYELFSAHIMTQDVFGNTVLTKTNIVSYDAAMGTITIKASVDKPIPANTILDMDFYTDGYFERDLPPEIMFILGLCFKVAWLGKLFNDFLDLTPKVEDRSFTEQNRANKERADTEKYNAARRELAAEMKRYEQNLAARKYVSPINQLI